MGSLVHVSRLETHGWQSSCFALSFRQPYAISCLKVVRNPKESLLSHQQLPQWLPEIAPESARGLATPSLDWLTLPYPQSAVSAYKVFMGDVKVKGGQGVGLLPTGLVSLQEEEAMPTLSSFSHPQNKGHERTR